MRGYHYHVQIVDFLEFRGLCIGRAGHPGQFFIHSEIILKSDRGKGLILPLYFHALFGFQGLVQSVAETPSRHCPTSKLVHYYNLAVLDKVIHVTMKKHVRL